MPNDRIYQVLARSGGEHGPAFTTPTFVDLGTHSGHDAKAAIEAALGVNGLPEGTKICAAVPTNNWSECDVAPDPRPQFKVTPRKTPSAGGGGTVDGA